MTDALRFTTTLPRGPLQAGRRVVLNLELLNEGPSAVLVNARFAVVPSIGDVRLVVRRNGAAVPFRYRVRLRVLSNGDFLSLGPGERVVAGFELSGGYDVSTAGTYEVEAEYVSEEIPPVLEKEPVFRGRLRAPKVELSIA